MMNYYDAGVFQSTLISVIEFFEMNIGYQFWLILYFVELFNNL